MSPTTSDSLINKMRLTREEITTLEKYLGIIERADRRPEEFIKAGSELMFTPGALLAVAVANFVYRLYQDYGALAVDPGELTHQVKRVIQSLHTMESVSGDRPSLDMYEKLRREIVGAKDG